MIIIILYSKQTLHLSVISFLIKRQFSTSYVYVLVQQNPISSWIALYTCENTIVIAFFGKMGVVSCKKQTKNTEQIKIIPTYHLMHTI